MKIVMVVIMFFLLGAFFIISENNLNIREEKELKNFNNLYVAWLYRVGNNLKGFTSYVVKLNWLPDSSSNG